MGRRTLPRHAGLAGRSARALTRGVDRIASAPSLPTPEPAIRFFASSHRLDQLSPRTRILCALFLLGLGMQAISGVLMHHRGPGWTPASVAAYYRGAPAAAAAPAGDDLAPLPPPTLALGKSFASLLEVAHLHLLAMPLALFVVAHLFGMTAPGRSRWAGALCYGTFACGLADALLPFAVRFGPAGFAPAKLAAFIGLEVGLLAMIAMVLVAALASLRAPSGGTPAQ